MVDHDELFLKVNFDTFMTEVPPHLNDFPFNQIKESDALVQSKKRNIEKYGSPLKNFMSEKKIDLFSRIEALLRSKIRNLCTGNVS